MKAETIFVILAMLAFVSGAVCLVWAWWFNGPEWAFLWAILGLPASMALGSKSHG